jgi:hypothetical protein
LFLTLQFEVLTRARSSLAVAKSSNAAILPVWKRPAGIHHHAPFVTIRQHSLNNQ